MSNIKNTISNKELSFIEIILNLWKFKIYFIVILLFSFIASFLLDSFVPKKTKYEIELKNPNLVNKLIFPVHYIHDVTILKTKSVMSAQPIEAEEFYKTFFHNRIVRKENIYNFIKIENKRFNLQEYASNNNINIKTRHPVPGSQNFIYSINLPKNKKNDDFLNNYILYTLNLSLKQFKNQNIDVLKKRKLIIKKKNKEFEEYLNKTEPTSEQISDIYDLRNSFDIKLLDAEISFLEKFEMNIDQIVVGRYSEQVYEKVYKILKIIIPIIFSSMLYVLFVLIRITKHN